MKLLNHIANPVFMLLIIGTFAYTYIFYFRDTDTVKKREAEMERETRQQTAQATDPNIAVAAGTAAQERDQFIGQQNLQNPLVMPEENPFNPQQPEHGNRIDNPVNRPVQARFGGAAQQPIAAPDKVLQEGHWIGLEVIPLTAALAKANNIDPEISGVLVDEVTLLSAEAGFLAGDVITAVNGKTVKDLKSFRHATKQVAVSNKAVVTVHRGGQYRNIAVFSTEELGIAQMEAAPMILASSRSPHGYYGPCDRCHAISVTPVNAGQLAKDMGDSLTKVAPNIRRGTPPPHRNRGACKTCHTVL